MFEFLLTVSISCKSAKAIIARVNLNEELPKVAKVDIVQQIKSAVSETCDWDAND
jgi:hypothetical protein